MRLIRVILICVFAIICGFMVMLHEQPIDMAGVGAYAFLFVAFTLGCLFGYVMGYTQACNDTSGYSFARFEDLDDSAIYERASGDWPLSLLEGPAHYFIREVIGKTDEGSLEFGDMISLQTDAFLRYPYFRKTSGYTKEFLSPDSWERVSPEEVDERIM